MLSFKAPENQQSNISEILSHNNEITAIKVSPIFFNVIFSSVKFGGYDFKIEISAEAFWTWRSLPSNKALFDSLNDSLHPLGYQISYSGNLERQLRTMLHRILKQVKTMNTKKRKSYIASKWFSVTVTGEEMSTIPFEVIQEKQDEINALEKEKVELNQKLEEKSETVLKLLCQGLENDQKITELSKATNVCINRGKTIDKVHERQQRRKLTEVR